MKTSVKRTELLLLILFDERQVMIYQDKLGEYGYQNIISCTKAGDAIQVLASGEFSLAIIDAELQDELNGIDLGRKVRQEFNLPIIYLSRLQDEITFTRALETQPIAFLSKPVNWNELRMAIESARFRNQEMTTVNNKKDEYKRRFDRAPLPCIVLDIHGRLTEVNNAWIELTGYSSQEVIGKWFGDFTLTRFHQIVREYFDAIAKKEKIQVLQCELLKKNEQKIIVSVEGKLQLGPANENISINCILNDITEKKRIKDKLEESEERFRLLFEEAPLGYQSLASDGSILYVNNTWCNLIGYYKNEVVGRWFGDFLKPVDKERFSTNFSVFKQKGFAQNIQYEMIKKDGSIIFVSIDGKVRYNEGGNYIQSHCIIKDITEQKVIEKKLVESERKFRNLIESAGDIIYILDHDLKYIYGNNECLKRYGLTREELIGKSYRDFHSKESIGEFYEKIRGIQKSGEPVIYEHQSLEDGRYFLRTLSPTIDPETKELEYIIVISKDISGLKKTEQVLLKRENEIRTITDNIPALVSYVDSDGYYSFVNKQYEKWFGISTEKILGKHVKEVLGKSAFEQIRDHIDGAQAGRRITFDDKVNYSKGGSRWVTAEYIPDIDESGWISGFFALVTDITKRKQAEEELQMERKRLHDLLEIMPVMVCLLTPDYHVKFANRAFRKKFGESNGRHCYEYCFGKNEPCNFCESYRVLKTGKPHRWQVTKLCRDDTIIDTYDYPFTDADGSELILEVGIDLTQQKKAEQALQTSQSKLSNAMEIARLGYWEYDVLKDTFTFNDHFYAIYHTTAAKIGGYTMKSERYANLFVHPEDRYMVGAEIKKVLETNDPNYSRQLEHRILYADGMTGYILVRFYIIQDEQGRTIRTYGANQDITERKRTESALEESEAMLRVINENIDDIIWQIDKDTKITYMSPSVEKILGYRPEETIGQPIMNFIAKEYHLSAIENIESRINQKKSNQPVYYEYEMLTRDGRKIPIEVSSTAIRDVQGSLIGFAGVTRIISERKKTESALQTSEARFKAFMENLPVITYIKNKEGKYVYGNKANLKFAGKTITELLDSKVSDFLPADLTRLMNQMDKKVLDTGEPVELDAWRYVKGKNERWFKEYKFPIISADEEKLIGGWMIDITNRIATESALKESAKLYKDLIEKAGLAITTKDINGNIVYFNHKFARLFGYTISEMKNISKDILFIKEDLKKVNTYHRLRMKGDKIPENYEIRGVKKNCDEIWIEVKITLLREKNKIVGTRNYMWDITQRKKVQKAIEDSVTRFRELFNNMSSGVAIYKYDAVKKDFVFKDMNRTGIKIYRVKYKKEILNKYLLDCFPGAKGLGLWDALMRVYKSGVAEKIPNNVYHDDRITLYVENFIYKLNTGELVAVYDDIGERVLAEEYLIKSYEQIRKLTQHLENIREEERKYIASELHDELGQILTAVKMDLSWIRNKMPQERKGIKKRIESTNQIIDEAILKIQQLSTELRPRMLDDLGILETLKAYFADYQKRTGILVRYKIPFRELNVIPGQEISIFRIIQEVLNNAARHARASEIILEMYKKADKLFLKISDNGIGISEEQIHSSDSLGIMIIKDRVSQWNGNIEIKGNPGKGTTINVDIPL